MHDFVYWHFSLNVFRQFQIRRNNSSVHITVSSAGTLSAMHFRHSVGQIIASIGVLIHARTEILSASSGLIITGGDVTSCCVVTSRVNSLTAASKGGRQRTVAAARGVTSDPNFHMRPPRITDRSQIKTRHCCSSCCCWRRTESRCATTSVPRRGFYIRLTADSQGTTRRSLSTAKLSLNGKPCGAIEHGEWLTFMPTQR